MNRTFRLSILLVIVIAVAIVNLQAQRAQTFYGDLWGSTVAHYPASQGGDQSEIGPINFMSVERSTVPGYFWLRTEFVTSNLIRAQHQSLHHLNHLAPSDMRTWMQ